MPCISCVPALGKVLGTQRMSDGHWRSGRERHKPLMRATENREAGLGHGSQGPGQTLMQTGCSACFLCKWHWNGDQEGGEGGASTGSWVRSFQTEGGAHVKALEWAVFGPLTEHRGFPAWWLRRWRICLQCRRCSGRKDPLGKGMATHFSTLAWRIPWTEEPGGLTVHGVTRVKHDWSDLACTLHARLCLSSTTWSHLIFVFIFALLWEKQKCQPISDADSLWE